MGKITYLIKSAAKMDYARLARTIRHAAKASHKPSVYIAFDMLRCASKYLAAPADYNLFEFYNLTPHQRASYVTRGINNRLVKKYNDRSKWHIFDDKSEFNTVFAKYVGREWIRLDKSSFDEFSAFIAGRETFFYKPLDLSCGKGIEKIAVSEIADMRELYERLKSYGAGLCEEAIVQHETMSGMFSGSVNTIRLVTMNDGSPRGEVGDVEIVFAFLRVGNGHAVDNLNSGGMAAPIDIATGIVTHPGADKDYKAYERHPATGTAFVGFAIPRFEEAKALVREAAAVVPSVGYIGWDVAVTRDGLCLVEANSYPGHDILQLPPHVPERIGLMGRVERYL
ncbi:MAG: hypothetical protein LBN02_02635 [Oscillospiraceae bacterium]|jgi:hypothetical protein|nr:hypothetical protein [Oscillospiraceae bacterium]